MPNSPANVQLTLVFRSSFILILVNLCISVCLFCLFEMEGPMTSFNTLRSTMKAEKILQKQAGMDAMKILSRRERYLREDRGKYKMHPLNH